MGFAVRQETRPAGGGRTAELVVLEDGAGGQACVWPALGFNCFSWRLAYRGGALDLLYADPGLFTEPDPRPTRSGIPVLFPFPNRIRDGRFQWAGKEYRLPPNDPAKKNAIHGFTCRHPGRVIGQGTDAGEAWVRGAFRASQDAPGAWALWPADYQIELTCSLGDGRLRLEAHVHNPDSVPLPFGLGYHPYFHTPFTPTGKAEDCTATVPAWSFWALEDSLPTGQKQPVAGDRDLNTPKPCTALNLDDVLTDLPPAPQSGGPHERAVLRDGPAALRVLCSEDFTDLVVFTPPHRHAFCVEPYTCTTDAVNLQAGGVEAGWRVLPPGGRWSSVVELRVE
jgi:aldose 1-epimerase